MSAQQVVFIVDDDLDDHLLYQIGLDRSDIDYTVKLFSDGQELLEYLAELMQHSGEQDIYLPCLILLDMHMPGMNGLEVLEELQQNIFLNKIPVAMVAGSASPDDIERGYAAGIDWFMKKPSTLQGYLDFLKTLGEYILSKS